MQSERHPNNESALGRAAVLSETMTPFTAFIVEDDGIIVLSGPELLREIDVRKNAAIGKKASAAKSPSSR